MRKPKPVPRGRNGARPVSTGSASTPPVHFRLGAIDRERLDAYAREHGIKSGGVARAATLAVLDEADRILAFPVADEG